MSSRVWKLCETQISAGSKTHRVYRAPPKHFYKQCQLLYRRDSPSSKLPVRDVGLTGETAFINAGLYVAPANLQ